MTFHIIITGLYTTGMVDALASAKIQLIDYPYRYIWVVEDDAPHNEVMHPQPGIMIWRRMNRHYCAKNQFEVIKTEVLARKVNGDDVLVFLDGDDRLLCNDTLNIVRAAYSKNRKLLLTYGSYCHRSDGHVGVFNGPYRTRKTFRGSQWHGTHLKTCKIKLWRHLPESVFKDKEGNWLKVSSDCAMMYALMEMAGHDRIENISKVIYEYNDENPENDHKVNSGLQVETDKWLRKQKPFERLAEV